jgi:hypothetical protein
MIRADNKEMFQRQFMALRAEGKRLENPFKTF